MFRPDLKEGQSRQIAIGLGIAALLVVPLSSVSAQKIVYAGSLLLAGYRATCGPVQAVVAPMRDIAAAQNGRIYLNPALLSLPRAQQMFWYTHECAHFIFGKGEARADCWAVQQGRIQGWLSPTEFQVLVRSMRAHPGDATHVAGPRRVAAMRRCYDSQG